MQHSNIVGGSTAKRVINCPGSVGLVNKVPPKGSSDYANEGTMLHQAMAEYWESNSYKPETFIGFEHSGATMDQDLFERKFLPAIKAIDELDPLAMMQYAVETLVSFNGEPELEGVFGSTDFLGRIGNCAYVIDWKFGDGVYVEAEENPQLLFYAAAAMRTPKVEWVFEGVTHIMMVIVQPRFGVSTWETSPKRVKLFERDLIAAVKKAKRPDAEFCRGEWCKWCAAKPVCPLMTGAADRAMKAKIDALDKAQIAEYLEDAAYLEEWVKSLQELAETVIRNGGSVNGWKLVEKRATKKWVDETTAEEYLSRHLDEAEYTTKKIITPTQAEKLLKQQGVELSDGVIDKSSSGFTLAKESDKRPSVVTAQQRLATALSKM
jgi:hypothetical protein